jgi:hypothetical protein
MKTRKNASGAKSSAATVNKQPENSALIPSPARSAHESDALCAATLALQNKSDKKDQYRALLEAQMEALKLLTKYRRKEKSTKKGFSRLAESVEMDYDDARLKAIKDTLASPDYDAALRRLNSMEATDKECQNQFAVFQWIEYRRLWGFPLEWLNDWLEYRYKIMPKWLRAKRAQEKGKKKKAAKAGAGR